MQKFLESLFVILLADPRERRYVCVICCFRSYLSVPSSFVDILYAHTLTIASFEDGDSVVFYKYSETIKVF